MLNVSNVVAIATTEAPWFDVQAAWAARFGSVDKGVVALAQLIIPAGFDQDTVDIEIAETTAGVDGSVLWDTDGVTRLSRITVPATLPARIALDLSVFACCKAARVVLPAAASAAFAFGFDLRKAG